MNKNHTPGPWEFVPKLTGSENHRGFFVRADKANKHGKWALAEVQPGDEDGTIGGANARLIAAAPDLLMALQMLYSETADYIRLNNLGGMDNQCMKLARAALVRVGAV